MFTRMALLLLVAWAGFVPFEAKAMFLLAQTKQVPMERLFANLQQRLAQDTNDFEQQQYTGEQPAFEPEPQQQGFGDTGNFEPQDTGAFAAEPPQQHAAEANRTAG